MNIWIIPKMLASTLVALVLIPIPAATANQSCESLASLKLPGTTITSARDVAQGPSTFIKGLGAPHQGPPPLEDSAIPELPAFCRVQITVSPAIKIEVWLPASSWNGNFEGVGTGGKAGYVTYPDMAGALKAGYATANTDTGHDRSHGVSGWALGHPELVVDFGYRAIHEMTVTAKKLTETFYGTRPRFSYFNGCSNAGRAGLKEAQLYPGDYDGILSGDPVIDYTRVQVAAGFWLAYQAQKDPEGYIPNSKLPAINAASVAACDALDGVKDGLIDDPRRCSSFMKDPSVLLCKGPDSATCLTAKQLGTLKQIYAGYHEVHGEEVYPGSMPGHETAWKFIATADPSKPLDDNAAVGIVGFLKYFFFGDPNWDYRTWDYERDLPVMDKQLASILNSTDPNLKPFHAHGGKLLLYHGWTDPGISPLATIHYYKDVVATMTGAKADAFQHETGDFLHAVNQEGDFIRLFMVPGMDHCDGGPGPNEFDAFSSLVNWVEHERAPERIIASHETRGVVDRTRPLCSYPMTAQYTGQGSIDDATNFVCKVPSNR